MYYNVYLSNIGNIVLESDGTYLVGLYFDEQIPSIITDLKIFAETKNWLDIYFAGKNPNFKIPIKFRGTSFQIKVWQFLENIEYGKYTSYGDIAKNLNTSPRAVGNAVGKNKIAIIIPCHRVLGKDKSLTGFAYGLDRKKYLLDLEKIEYKL